MLKNISSINYKPIIVLMHFHKHILRNGFLLCLLILSISLSSQVKFVSDSSYLNSLSHLNKGNLRYFKYTKVDSSINNFQNYLPRNTNGNYGLPSAPLYFEYKVRALGFNLYQAPYQNDMISSDDVKYFQSKGPYANLTGIAGSKQEQNFRMIFTNSFKNKLNLTVAFNRYGGLGFLNRQQTFTNNFYTSSNYANKSNRVGYYAYFLFNKVKHLENGGIKDDSLFIEDVTINKNLLPVNLSNAKRELRYSTINFNPWFRINREDSSALLSHYMDYEVNYSGNFTKYSDDDVENDDYYSLYYFNDSLTKDSTHWRTISNAINYTLKINPLDAKLRIGFKNEYNRVHQYFDSTLMNNMVNAGFYLHERYYDGFVKVDYIVNGANQNDYSLEINNRYQRNILYHLFKSSIVVNLNAQIEKRHPDYMQNLWYSNHFQWSNNFSPVDKFQGHLSLGSEDSRFQVGAITQSIKNYIYFDEFARPQQTSLTVQNLALYIKKDFLFFKHLGLNLGYNYQSSSYQTIVGTPNQIANGALYYQGNLFKKALQLQIGFSAQYFSEFNGLAYMPATNIYYVQTQKMVGNYPFVDFFLNARIKPVRFFIKIDHVSQGFLGNNYYLTPGYLQNDRAFKFGLNWVFFD